MRTGAGFPSYNSSPASPSPEAATPYAQHNPYQSPLPFIFGGLAAMLSLCVFALLILACSYLRLSGYLDGSDADPDRRTSGAENQACAGPMPPPCLGEFVVIMAGDEMPTFLATPIRSRASSFADDGKDTAATSTAESASPTRAAVARTENSEE